MNQELISDGDRSFNCSEGRTLKLRRFALNDAEIFQKYRDVPAVAIFQSWERFTLDDAVRFIREMADIHPNQSGHWFQFAIEHKLTGELIGDVALGPWREDPRQSMVGFTIAPWHQRKGYAFEALHLLLGYAFHMLHKHRIVAEIDPRNVASDNLLRKVGFREEGYSIQDAWTKGAWADTRFFALLGSEYLARGQNPLVTKPPSTARH